MKPLILRKLRGFVDASGGSDCSRLNRVEGLWVCFFSGYRILMWEYVDICPSVFLRNG